MTKFGAILSRPVLVSFLVFGLTPTPTLAGDLSKYRNFQLGTDLLTVAKKTGMNPSDAKVIHRRPALIQELQWYPQPLGPSSGSEPAKDVFFSFHNGELFQIAINYDRHETEGLTADDFVEAFSATYGIAAKPTALARATQGRRSGGGPRTMGRSAVPLRPDPFLVRAQLPADRCPQEAGSAGPSRHSAGKTAR